MPLTESFLNRIKEDEEKKTRIGPSLGGTEMSALDASRQIVRPGDEPEDDFSLMDMAGSALWGAASGMTFSAASAFHDKPWEEMGTDERIGWAAGEALALVSPIGPFSLIGKGAGKAVSAFASSGGKRITAEAIKKVTTEAAKKGLAAEVVEEGLRKQVYSKVGKRWLQEHSVGGEALEEANVMMSRMAHGGIKKAFTDGGIEISDDVARDLGGKFADALKVKGNHLNTVDSWVENALQTKLPFGVNERVARYLGMGAQDMVVLGVHGLIDDAVKSRIEDRDYEPLTTMEHVLMMSATFPLVRGIKNIGGWGKAGHGSLKQGWKSMMNKYASADYKGLTKKHGEETTRGLLQVLTNGGRYNVASKGMGKDRVWDVAGEKYASAKINSSINTMPMDHVYDLLGQYKKEVGRFGLSTWSKGYAADYLASVPRMVAGAMAMNWEMIKTGQMDDLDPREAMTHLFIAGLMTKSRGAWGRDTMREYVMDFQGHQETMDLLNIKHEGITEMIQTYNEGQTTAAFGASYRSNPVAQKLEQIYEKRRNDQTHPESEYTNEGTNFKIVEDFSNIVNMMGMSASADPGTYPRIEVRRLGKANLEAMKAEIEEIQFANGDKLGELGYSVGASRITGEVANANKQIYFNMFQELNDAIGLPVRVANDGKSLELSTMNIPLGTSLGEFGTVQSALHLFRDIGLARETVPGAEVGFRIKDDGKLVRTDIKDKNDPLYDKDLNPIVDGIVDKYTSLLVKSNHGNDFNRYVSLDGADNPYLKAIIHNEGVQALEKVYKMSTRDMENMDTTEKNFVVAADRALRIKDAWEDPSLLGRILADPGQYTIGEKKLTGKDKDSPDAIEKAAELSENLTVQIREIIHPMIAAAETSARDPKTKHTIPFEVAESLVEEYNKLGFRIPADNYLSAFGRDFESSVENYTMSRLLRDWNYSDEALNIVMAARDVGMLTIDARGGLEISSVKAIRKQAVAEGLEVPTQNDLARKHAAILDIVAGPKVTEVGEIFQADPATGLQPFYANDVNKVYNRLNTVFAKKVSEQAERALKLVDRDLEGKKIELNRTDIMSGIDKFNKTGNIENLAGVENALKNLRNDFGGKEGYEAVLTQLEGQIGRFKDARLESNKILTEVYGDYTMSIGEGIQYIADRSETANNKIAQVMDKINLLGKDPMTRGEALRHKDFLMKQLMSELGTTDNLRKNTLDEAVDVFLQGRTHEDLAGLMVGVHKVIEQNRAFNVDQVEQMKADAAKFGELYKESVSHLTTIKDLHIAKKYGLTDPDNINKIDPKFIENMETEGIHTALYEVRDQIYANKDYVNDNQKREAWKTFRAEEMPILIKGAFASIGGSRKTVQIYGNNVVVRDNVPGRSNKSDDFYNVNNYDVFFLEQKGILADREQTVEARDDLFDILNGEGPKGRKTRVNQDWLEYYAAEGRNADKFELEDKTSQYIEGMPPNELVPMDINAGRTVLFHWTKDNQKRLNTNFAQWYEAKRNRLSGNQKLNFEDSFGHLSTLESPGFKDAELKMFLMHADYTNTSGLNRFLQSDVFTDATARSEWYDKYFKYSKSSEGGNTSRMTNEVLTYMSTHHPDMQVRQAFKDVVRDGVNATAVQDEFYDASNPFYNLNNIRTDITAISVDQARSQAERDNATAFLTELTAENKPSTQSSSIDGGMFINQKLARVIWALEGKEIGDFNGLKPIVFHNNPEAGSTAILKGFMVYHPDIAGRMGNSDIFMGESTAKEFGRDGLVPLRFSNPDWRQDMHGLGPDNTINILPSDIGLGFHGEAGKGVVLSHTLNDFHDVRMTQAVQAWQGLEKMVTEISGYNTELLGRSNNELSDILYDMKAREGFEFDQGINSLAQKLLVYGMETNNGVIKTAIGRLYRSKMIDILRKPITSKGADTYIIPEITAPEHSLRNPVIRRVEMDVNGTIVDTGSRIYTRFGGARVGNSFYKKPVSSIGELDFIYNDNGMDIVIRKSGKDKPDLSNWSVHNTYEQMVRGRGARFAGGDPYSNYNFSTQTQSRVRDIISQIDAYVKDKTLSWSYGDVFNLLNTGIARVRDRNGKRIVKKLQQLRADVKKYDIQLGINAVAIPKKSYDIGFHRVEGISSRVLGETSSVNAYDLRVMHQRDFDGDHLYSWYGTPFEVLSHNINKMGIISDYHQMDKTPHDIDPMGFGESIAKNKPRAGAMNRSIGFSKLKQFQQGKAIAVGANIGMKNVINWMQNVGLRIGDNAIRPLNNAAIGEGRADQLNSGETIGVLARMANINQSTVDQWGGSNSILLQNMRNFLLYGEIPTGMENAVNPVNQHMNLQSIFTGTLRNMTRADAQSGQVRQTIERDIVDIISGTMRKASMIFNDTYDSGGRHTPENWELSKVQDDLRFMFKSPNLYVAKKLLWKHRKDEAKQIGIVKMFYDAGGFAKHFRLGDRYALNMILKDIRKGNVPTPSAEVVKFSTIAPARDKNNQAIRKENYLMGLNNSGYLINQVLENRAFGSESRFGTLSKDAVSSATKFTSNLIDRVAFMQAFGHNVTEPIKLMHEDGTLDSEAPFLLQYKDGLGNHYRPARQMQMEGAVHSLLTREAARLGRNIQKYRAGGKFMKFDLENATERYEAVEAAMNTVENRAMSEVKPVDIKLTKLKAIKDQRLQQKSIKVFENKYVYAYRGDILDSKDFGRIKYEELNDAIGFVKAGDRYTAKPGMTYIEVKKPIIHQSISDDEARAGVALYKAASYDMNPAKFFDETTRFNFSEHTALIQSEISDNYRDVLKQLKAAGSSGTAYSSDLWGQATTKDQWLLDAYFKRFAGKELDKEQELLMAVKYLVMPRPMQGRFISTKGEIPGVPEVPYFAVNKRLLSATFEWLSRNGFLEVDGSGAVNERLPGMQKFIESWGTYDKQMRNGKDWEFEDINKSLGSRNLMYMNNYNFNFEKLGSNASLVGNMMADHAFYDPAMETMIQDYNVLPSGREISKFTADPLKSQKIKKRLLDRGCKN